MCMQASKARGERLAAAMNTGRGGGGAGGVDPARVQVVVGAPHALEGCEDEFVTCVKEFLGKIVS